MLGGGIKVMLSESNGVFALKRIKRTSDFVNNYNKISDDFIILNPRFVDKSAGKDNISIDTDPQKIGKELDNLYDEVMASFNITKAKAKERVKVSAPNHGQNKLHKIANKESRSTIAGLGKKHSIVAPLAYVLRERDRKLNERLMANNHNYIAPPEEGAKVVIINNSPKDLQKLTLVPKVGLFSQTEIGSMSEDFKHGALTENTDAGEIGDNIEPIAAAREIIGVPRIMPQKAFPVYRPYSMNPFAPMEQMFRFANMVLYKVAKDSGPIPIHSQTASLTLTPANQPEVVADDSDTLDYYYNTMETPSSSHSIVMTPPVALPPIPIQNNDQPNSVLYGPPFIFKQPVPASEPKQVLNLVENALDTLSAATDEDDGDNDIELRCPIHHEKKSIAGGNCIGENSSDRDDNGIIQVCSCRFIKNKKQNFEM
uniref:Uncharacterized protein n=1 Tax=Glossina austeni TaxID=7395 RepID=A0A1A9VUB1_GLOAU